MRILIIDICKEKLHKNEFVKPVEDILRKNNMDFFTKHYKKITQKDINKFDKIIICGTSLRDNDFLKNIKYFQWLKNFKKPVLGICGGSHIIGLILEKGNKKLDKEIGLKKLKLEEKFLGAESEIQAHYLHQFRVLPEVFKERNFYATLFHPEVRNKKMIVKFCNL
ncbi:MAG: hypothetical protein WDZ62_01425 [Candidatus Pacearchaeota archaeon]